MKKTIFLLTLALSVPVWAEESAIKQGIKGTVSDLVSAGKEAIAGGKQGIDEGRQSGTSVDGAVIIVDAEKLKQYATVNVLSTEDLGGGDYKLTLALRNTSKETIRLSNLGERNSLQLLDEDGFVSFLKTLPLEKSDITIPANAAVKQRYVFGNVEDKPAVFRLYGVDFPLAVSNATPAK